MRFLWKSQLKRERGKFLPQTPTEKKKVTRQERLQPRKNQILLWGVALLWLFFLGTVVYLVLFSPYLMFTSWQLEGLELVSESGFRQTVDQELSQKYLGLLPRNTFFLVRPSTLERVIHERYPLVRDVSVRRIFPDQLKIVVRERSTILSWCSADQCSQILEDGSVLPATTVMEEPENRSHMLRLLDESGQALPTQAKAFDGGFVALVLALREGLQSRFGIGTEDTARVVSRFADELRFRTADGWEIYFSTRLPLETSLNALGLLLDSEIPGERLKDLDYIDLRIENRVFYRYRDGSGPAVAPVMVVPQTDTKEKKKKD